MTDITRICPRCKGTGIYKRSDLTSPDGTTDVEPCPTCNGAGVLVVASIDLGDINEKLESIKTTVKTILDKIPPGW